jgi:hypothetical protein
MRDGGNRGEQDAPAADQPPPRVGRAGAADGSGSTSSSHAVPGGLRPGSHVRGDQLRYFGPPNPFGNPSGRAPQGITT